MTRAQAPPQATLQLMQAERRYDKVTRLPQKRTLKPSPKRSAGIVPFTGFRTR